jgi:hypothetical protein
VVILHNIRLPLPVYYTLPKKKLFIQQGTPFVHPACAGLGGIAFLCNFAAEKIKET